MNPDNYKLNDLQRVQKELDNLHNNNMILLRIKYAAIFSVLVYGLSNNNPFTTLLPPFITIPIYIIANGYHKSICRNAAYIIVFYGLEFAPEWELRLRAYSKLNPKQSSRLSRFSVLSYIGEWGMSAFAFWITCPQYLKSHSNLQPSFIYEFIQWEYNIFAVLFIYFFASILIYRYKVNYIDEKEKCIEKWTSVKKEENLDRLRHLREVQECVDIWNKIKKDEKFDKLPVSL